MTERFMPQPDDDHSKAEVPDNSAGPQGEHIDPDMATESDPAIVDEASQQSPDPTARMLAAEFEMFGGSRPREDRPDTPDGMHRWGHR